MEFPDFRIAAFQTIFNILPEVLEMQCPRLKSLDVSSVVYGKSIHFQA